MAFEISPVLNYFYQGIENSVQTLKIQYSLDTPILEQMYQLIDQEEITKNILGPPSQYNCS